MMVSQWQNQDQHNFSAPVPIAPNQQGCNKNDGKNCMREHFFLPELISFFILQLSELSLWTDIFALQK